MILDKIKISHLFLFLVLLSPQAKTMEAESNLGSSSSDNPMLTIVGDRTENYLINFDNALIIKNDLADKYKYTIIIDKNLKKQEETLRLNAIRSIKEKIEDYARLQVQKELENKTNELKNNEQVREEALKTYDDEIVAKGKNPLAEAHPNDETIIKAYIPKAIEKLYPKEAREKMISQKASLLEKTPILIIIPEDKTINLFYDFNYNEAPKVKIENQTIIVQESIAPDYIKTKKFKEWKTGEKGLTFPGLNPQAVAFVLTLLPLTKKSESERLDTITNYINEFLKNVSTPNLKLIIFADIIKAADYLGINENIINSFNIFSWENGKITFGKKLIKKIDNPSRFIY